jgi:DNA-binding MarR family transcriptional regulator
VSDRQPQRRLGRGSSSRPSPAALGVTQVGDDFDEEFPDGDARCARVASTLVRTGTSIVFEIERSIQRELNVSQPVITALAVIEGAEGPLTPTQIGDRMLSPSATMTSTLDVLEGRGWIERRPNPDDRRSFLIAITEAGRETTDRFLPGIRSIERATLAGLTPKELDQMLLLLEKVLARTADVAKGEPIPLGGRRNRPKRSS